MTVLSVGEDLLQALAPDRPCGDDLEDTALLASFDTFRVFGQAAPHEPVPEWGAIRAKAAEALCRSKDLRLLAHLATAVLRTDGLPAFAETLTIASRWLELYWRDTYPRIDEDAIFRRNALNCFADPIAVVDGVRRAPLVSSPQHGTYSLRDVEIAAGLLAADDGKAAPEQARVEAAFAAAPRDELARLQGSVAGALAALARIDTRMSEDSVNASPGFAPLSSQLGKIDRLLRKHLTPADGSDGAAAAGDGAAPAGVTGAAVGAIRSRQDAIRALEAVADFFRHSEPSSPIPLIVDRAKRLVSKDFLDVLADIAPGAVSQARAAGGLKDDS